MANAENRNTETQTPDEDLRAIDEAMPQWAVVSGNNAGRRFCSLQWVESSARELMIDGAGLNPVLYRANPDTPTGWEPVEQGESR